MIFRRLTGVDIELFSDMCSRIAPLWDSRRHNFDQGGCPHSIVGLENHLLAMLIYYRSYVSHAFLGVLFNVHETTAMRSVKRVEKLAVKRIHIEKKRELTREEAAYLIVDASEQPIQRPDTTEETERLRIAAHEEVLTVIHHVARLLVHE